MSKSGNKNLRNAEFNSASQQRDPESPELDSGSGLRVLILLSLIVIVTIILTVLPKTKKSQAPTNSQPTTTYNLPTTTLFFAGDIMLSRNVHDKMTKADNFTLPFLNIKDQASNADISFANLESPFNDTGSHFVPNSLVFNADPKSVDGLRLAGFDVLGTANNHSFDQGEQGLYYTLALLKQNSIAAVGTTTSCHDGVIIKKNQIKFGFLAYSYAAFNDGGKKSDSLVCNWSDSTQVQTDIKSLKSQADFVIVSAHMGTEYKREPDEINVGNARTAIDAGADLLIGHHPHWIQTIEEYKGRYIFYSLGNFVFDQMWSQDTREGLTILVTLESNSSVHPALDAGSNQSKIPAFAGMGITKIELMPVVIENYCCPRWADSSETASILKKVNLTSNILVDNND
ncbi:MAG: CapA family protein [Candidatus Doudnabacteria bacterium]|nr:CapA family protein [Candidatus Doudnabacteria bacterium]